MVPELVLSVEMLMIICESSMRAVWVVQRVARAIPGQQPISKTRLYDTQPTSTGDWPRIRTHSIAYSQHTMTDSGWWHCWKAGSPPYIFEVSLNCDGLLELLFFCFLLSFWWHTAVMLLLLLWWSTLWLCRCCHRQRVTCVCFLWFTGTSKRRLWQTEVT